MFLKYGIRWLLALLLTLAAGAQILGYMPATLVDRIDLFIYDMRLRLQPASPDPRIVIIDIDEKSLAEAGRWPWSRDVMAALVTRLTGQYQAKAVAFDVVFAEPDTSSGYNALEALAREDLKDVPKFAERVRLLKPTLDFDRRFADALDGKPVVLGYYLSNQQGAPRKGLLPPPAFSVADLNGTSLQSLEYIGYSGNLGQLQQAAAGGGFMNPTPDSDGIIRRLPLLARFGDAYYESLALTTARIALGASVVRPVILRQEDAFLPQQALRQYGAVEAIRLNSRPRQTRIPVERNLTALIRYRGPGGPDGGGFRYVSAVDVLQGRLEPQALAQKIVLVGTTVAGLKDLRSSPVAIDYPGVEMHANMIASILDGEFKTRPDFSIGFEIVQIATLGILLGLLLPMLTPAFAIATALAGAAGVIAFNFWMYQALDWVMPVATALLLVSGLFIVNIVWGYLFEYRKGRAIVSLFGEYVAPELVAEMAADPGRYSMEGESRVMTVMFADVRGFTTISESLDPASLREYINRYLTAVSEDIRGNRGTLDKYIGDAVMAFWGAPVTLPDHASLAVAAALRMQETAARLNRDFIARGWPPLKIGIGVNTGEMRVGDMGSRIRRAYTVMGDAVNLSSRLEGITKAYGVGIAVGGATRQAAPEFAYRELDHVRVKGRNEPVPIFEPVGLASGIDDATRHMLTQWHEALALFRSRQWRQAERILRELHAANGEDGLYTLYLERIEHFRACPPGQEWDGVTTFESK